MKKTVSIIVPIYKTKIELLENCLNSLARQSYDKLEIILIDDNDAMDKSGIFIDSFEFPNRLVKIFHQKNAGVSAARNKGIESSSGDYLMFVDSDDILHEDGVKIMVEAIEKNASDLVISSCNVVSKSKNQINHFYPQENIEKSTRDLLLQTLSKGYSSYYPPFVAVGVPWAKLFKAEIVRDNNIIFDTTMSKYEDLNFLIEYLQYTRKISNIRKPLYTYYIHESTLSHGYNPRIFEITKTAMNALDTTLKESRYQDLVDSLEIKKINEINSIMKQNVLNKSNNWNIKEKAKYISMILRDQYFSISTKLNTKKMTYKEKVVYLLVKNKLALLLILLFSIEERF